VNLTSSEQTNCNGDKKIKTHQGQQHDLKPFDQNR
jgi:hypothetical protein